MRITGEMLGKQTDCLDHLLNLLYAVGFIFKELEVVKALRNDIVDGCALVERRGGILEHHLDVSDHLTVDRARALARNANALILDLARRTGIHANDCTSDGGLTRTRLTNEREGLALVDVEACVFDCLDGVVALAEGDVNTLERNEDLSALCIDRTVLGQMCRLGRELLLLAKDAGEETCFFYCIFTFVVCHKFTLLYTLYTFMSFS